MVDKNYYYRRSETGFSFTSDKEKESVQKFNKKLSPNSKIKHLLILGFRYFVSKNLIFQHLPVKKDVNLDGKRYKDGNRLRNG